MTMTPEKKNKYKKEISEQTFDPKQQCCCYQRQPYEPHKERN